MAWFLRDHDLKLDLDLLQDVSPLEFSLVYDILSFTLATMMATTIFLLIRLPHCAERYQGPLIIAGLTTFVASYHYIRIFNSWCNAFEWNSDGTLSATGSPFNNAYRYMDWVLTVPLLMLEIVLVMNFSEKEGKAKAANLAMAAELMICLGYPGERFLQQETMGVRWMWGGLSMVPFLYIVHELLFGFFDVTVSETDPDVRNKIRKMQWWTVLAWCTYPVIYMLPMLNISGTVVLVLIQFGYSVSDIIAKCAIGCLVYNVTKAKTRALKRRDSETTPLKSQVI